MGRPYLFGGHDMKITAKITAQFADKGRLKAIATVCLDGSFLITGVRVADCEKGLSVFMPSRQLKSGEYKDILSLIHISKRSVNK